MSHRSRPATQHIEGCASISGNATTTGNYVQQSFNLLDPNKDHSKGLNKAHDNVTPLSSSNATCWRLCFHFWQCNSMLGVPQRPLATLYNNHSIYYSWPYTQAFMHLCVLLKCIPLACHWRWCLLSGPAECWLGFSWVASHWATQYAVFPITYSIPYYLFTLFYYLFRFAYFKEREGYSSLL